MSIMDMFRNVVTGPASQTAQPVVKDASINNPAVPGSATPQSDGTGVPAIPKAAEGDKSPLDGYTKLWEHADGDRKPVQDSPNITADPKRLMDVAKTIDFAKVIPAETLAAAAKGDVTALSAAINAAAQAGYAQSAHATSNIVKTALAEQARLFKVEVMPELLRQHTARAGLNADNPVFSNPAVAPIVGLVEAQLRTKYGSASAEEIRGHANDLFQGFATEIAKSMGMEMVKKPDANAVSSPSGPRQEQDWGKFFGVGEG